MKACADIAPSGLSVHATPWMTEFCKAERNDIPGVIPSFVHTSLVNPGYKSDILQYGNTDGGYDHITSCTNPCMSEGWLIGNLNMAGTKIERPFKSKNPEIFILTFLTRIFIIPFMAPTESATPIPVGTVEETSSNLNPILN